MANTDTADRFIRANRDELDGYRLRDVKKSEVPDTVVGDLAGYKLVTRDLETDMSVGRN